MAGNTFGTIFRVTTFGESHGAAIGVVVDGCPAGIPLELEDFTALFNTARPSGTFETARREPNIPEILSGVFEGKTLGTPIAVLLRNTDARPHDYEALKDIYGLYNYLKDFTIVAERDFEDIALWDEYLIMSSLFGISLKLSKELDDINPDYRFANCEFFPEDYVIFSFGYSKNSYYPH